MAELTIQEMEKMLKKELDEDRYRHTLGVMYTACALAMAHGEDIQKAQLAGLLHDCAKCISNKKKLKICEKKNIKLTDYEKSHPFMIHARLGAYLAKTVYKVKDEEILSAIAWHTTGKPEMSRLEKIIYIADYIEPGRFKAADLPLVRKQAFENLDLCMYTICRDTLEYLESTGQEVEENTRLACEYYGNLYL